MSKEKTRLQINVDLTKYPELYDALLTLEEELDTDKSKLIRNLIREKAQEHRSASTVALRAFSKIKKDRQD